MIDAKTISIGSIRLPMDASTLLNPFTNKILVSNEVIENIMIQMYELRLEIFGTFSLNIKANTKQIMNVGMLSEKIICSSE